MCSTKAVHIDSVLVGTVVHQGKASLVPISHSRLYKAMARKRHFRMSLDVQLVADGYEKRSVSEEMVEMELIGKRI